MDLTQLSDDQVQALADMGNFAALAEISRRNSLPTAIERDFIRDKQGDIQLVNFLPDDLMNYNEFYDMPIEQKRSNGILDALKTTGSNVLGFITNAGILGNLVDTNPLSQRRFDAMTPGQKAYTSSLYNPGGLLEGYNQISAFGEGALGT